ncbi:unnamed protein product [Malus baccata var. baccata]
MEDIDMESIGHGGTSSRCCFCFPSSWSRMRTPQNDDRWWSRGIRALHKLREWSEIVAGPRWKTFIRRFNRSRSIGRGAVASNHGKFQYDPLSYALNFDEGPVDEDDEVVGLRNFSVRYASFPQPAKSGGSTESGTDVAVYG